MTQQTVTHEEMAQALDTQARGLLKMLGVPLTAEMGQRPWLPGSDGSQHEPEPIIDLDKMADAVHTLAHNQEQLAEQVTATMGKANHPYGLCDNGDCPPCRDQRRTFATKLAPQVEKAALAQAGNEIDAACEWAGATYLRDQLSEVLAKYRAAGSPGLEGTDFNIIIEGVS